MKIKVLTSLISGEGSPPELWVAASPCVLTLLMGNSLSLSSM